MEIQLQYGGADMNYFKKLGFTKYDGTEPDLDKGIEAGIKDMVYIDTTKFISDNLATIREITDDITSNVTKSLKSIGMNDTLFKTFMKSEDRTIKIKDYITTMVNAFTTNIFLKVPNTYMKELIFTKDSGMKLADQFIKIEKYINDMRTKESKYDKAIAKKNIGFAILEAYNLYTAPIQEISISEEELQSRQVLFELEEERNNSIQQLLDDKRKEVTPPQIQMLLQTVDMDKYKTKMEELKQAYEKKYPNAFKTNDDPTQLDNVKKGVSAVKFISANTKHVAKIVKSISCLIATGGLCWVLILGAFGGALVAGIVVNMVIDKIISGGTIDDYNYDQLQYGGAEKNGDDSYQYYHKYLKYKQKYNIQKYNLQKINTFDK